MTHAIQGNSGVSPFEEHGDNLNLLYVLDLAEVVEVVVDAGLVETREHVQACRVVVVTVDAEDWKLYA